MTYFLKSMIILLKLVNPLLFFRHWYYSWRIQGFRLRGVEGAPTSNMVTFWRKCMAKRNNLLWLLGRGATATSASVFICLNVKWAQVQWTYILYLLPNFVATILQGMACPWYSLNNIFFFFSGKGNIFVSCFGQLGNGAKIMGRCYKIHTVSWS